MPNLIQYPSLPPLLQELVSLTGELHLHWIYVFRLEGGSECQAPLTGLYTLAGHWGHWSNGPFVGRIRRLAGDDGRRLAQYVSSRHVSSRGKERGGDTDTDTDTVLIWMKAPRSSIVL
jgi:hypothetical protein